MAWINCKLDLIRDYNFAYKSELINASSIGNFFKYMCNLNHTIKFKLNSRFGIIDLNNF